MVFTGGFAEGIFMSAPDFEIDLAVFIVSAMSLPKRSWSIFVDCSCSLSSFLMLERTKLLRVIESAC